MIRRPRHLVVAVALALGWAPALSAVVAGAAVASPLPPVARSVPTPTPTPTPVSVADPDPEPTPAAIDALVREHLDTTGLPGAAVAVTRGTRVLHAAGYGRTADGQPVTAHTPMAVASLSKSITALAVLRLVEAGRVRLDHPVREYLPEFTMADPRADAITVRQLLDQTSGLSDTTFPSFSRTRPNSLAESVAGLRGARLAADPGTRWEYYNVNAQVAARLVEVVSGQGFADHLRAHVFGPLGMADSSAVDTEDDLPPSAAGHLKLFDHAVALPEPPGFGGGSGGVLSSAHDLAAWLIAQNNGGRGANGTAVLSPELIAVSHTPSPPARDYALGWTVGRTPAGATRIAHGGDLFTATAYQALLPDSGYGIAVLANTGTAYGEAPALAGRLLALLENRPVPAPTSPGVLVDWVVLGLAVLVLLLAVRGVRRARRWAEARTGVLGTALRLLPHTLPVLFPLTVHHVVSVLYRGRDVTWLQVHYLYASGMLLVYILCAACTTILAARLTALVRLRSPR